MPPVDSKAPSFPPWAAPREWRAANAAVRHLVDRYGQALDPAASAARSTAHHLVSLFPLLDTLCAETCPHCPDPCCLAATIWVDFKDLLFLHLTGQPLPLGQLTAPGRNPCAGSGPRGCALPRLSRPWVCSWYLCPAQTARLKRCSESDRALYRSSVASIKASRERMERAFVEITAAGHTIQTGTLSEA